MANRETNFDTRQTIDRQALAPVANRVPRYVLPLAKSFIIFADAVLTTLCFFAAFKMRENGAILSATAWAWSKHFVPYSGILFFTIAARLAMFAYQRVYRLQGAFSFVQEAIKIFKAVTVSTLFVVAFAFLFRGGFAFRDFSYSRGVFLLDYVFALFVFIAFHIFLRVVQAQFRRRDINLIPTLIIGANAEAERTIKELNLSPDLGYRVVGRIGEKSGTNFSDEYQTPYLGSIENLSETVKSLKIQEVIITDNDISPELLFEAMMKIGRRQKVEFRLAPNIFNLLPQKTSVEQIGVLPMVRLFREPLSDVERFIKRAFDIVISLGAVAVSSPLWLFCALFIKLDSRGAILFRQERVGMDGRVFLCYKFRTMYADADEAIHRAAYEKNIKNLHESGAPNEEKLYGKVRNDPRITRIGAFLRRSSLDELPQFLNVLKGDMSIVGPRPPIPYEVESYELWHRKRLDIKPGITGLWQVSGRSRLTFEEMVKIDIFYIENWSLMLDLKIILLTLPAVLRGEGAK